MNEGGWVSGIEGSFNIGQSLSLGLSFTAGLFWHKHLKMPLQGKWLDLKPFGRVMPLTFYDTPVLLGASSADAGGLGSSLTLAPDAIETVWRHPGGVGFERTFSVIVLRKSLIRLIRMFSACLAGK
jgi:hypothetical protein